MTLARRRVFLHDSVLVGRSPRKREWIMSRDEEHDDAYTQAQLEPLRLLLVQERDAMLALNRRSLHDLRDQERVRGDSIDESTQEQGASTELRLRDREKDRLHALEHALDRIREGTYGQCEECAELIPLRRLKANPTAKLCVPCQELQERDDRLQRQRAGFFDELG